MDNMENLTCEIRYSEDESRQTPGRLVATLMTYGEQARDRREMFDVGSLRFPPQGLLIDEQHNRQAPILRAMPIVEGNTIRIDHPFPDTQRGRDAATNLREGVLTGLSVSFVAEQEEIRNGIRIIKRAYAPRAGLVDSPSYTGSKAEVRASGLVTFNPRSVYQWL